MKAPSKIVAIIAIVIGVFALIMITQLSAPVTTPKTDAELDKEAQEQAKKAQEDAIKKGGSQPPPMKTGARSESSKLVELGHDALLGAQNPNAPEVTVQWSWTPEVEADPMKVYSTITDIAKQVPNVRIHAVNTDEVEGIPDGVFVGNRQVTKAGPDGSIKFDAAAIQSALSQK